MGSEGETRKMRVITIGVGGPSCSGKTTLAKHLLALLPNSIIVHQDDFAPPSETLPIHPEYGVTDWDDAPTAIEWPRMESELQHIKQTGHVSDSHYSHEHMNEQKLLEVQMETAGFWKTRFGQVQKAYESDGYEVKWVIVEGFLLYWDKQVYDSIDVKFLLRSPEPILRRRRDDRTYYAADLIADGSMWKDPPIYWEGIVWPSYVRAHQDLFEGGDVEHGSLSGKIPDLIVFDSKDWTMTELLDRACRRVINKVDVDYQ